MVLHRLQKRALANWTRPSFVLSFSLFSRSFSLRTPTARLGLVSATMRLNRVPAVASVAFSLSLGVLALPGGGDVPHFGDLQGRAECKPYKIQSGDSCTKIAKTRCGGIKLDDLYKYNSGLKKKCNNLKVG